MDIEGKVHYDSGDREIRIRDIGNYEKTVGTGSGTHCFCVYVREQVDRTVEIVVF